MVKSGCSIDRFLRAEFVNKLLQDVKEVKSMEDLRDFGLTTQKIELSFTELRKKRKNLRENQNFYFGHISMTHLLNTKF